MQVLSFEEKVLDEDKYLDLPLFQLANVQLLSVHRCVPLVDKKLLC